MANRVADLPLLVVVAVRPGEPPTDAAALNAIAVGARRLPLAPLSERASARLVRGVRGPRAAGAFCRACHDVAGGNPFYLRELALETARQGIAPRADAAGRVARLGPGAVSDATLERIARLPPACAKLAPAVAVLGLDVALHDAAALAGLGVDEAQRAADELAAAGILQRSRPLNFTHPVLASAIYAELPPGARSQAHARAAAQLSDVQAVASHLLAVEPGRDAWTLERLRVAAADAMRRGAPTTAARFLRRALAETADASLRPRISWSSVAPSSWPGRRPRSSTSRRRPRRRSMTTSGSTPPYWPRVRCSSPGRFDAAQHRDCPARARASGQRRQSASHARTRDGADATAGFRPGQLPRWTARTRLDAPPRRRRSSSPSAPTAPGARSSSRPAILEATRGARAARVQALIERAVADGAFAAAADSLDEGHALRARSRSSIASTPPTSCSTRCSPARASAGRC